MRQQKRKLPRYLVAATFLAFMALAATNFAPSAEARLDGGAHFERDHSEKFNSFWANIIKLVKVIILHSGISGVVGHSGPNNSCS